MQRTHSEAAHLQTTRPAAAERAGVSHNKSYCQEGTHHSGGKDLQVLALHDPEGAHYLTNTHT